MITRAIDGLVSWASRNNKFWVRFHAVMALVWLVQILPAILTDLKKSLPYLIAISLLTAFSGEMAALHGSQNQEKK